jgi:hypothetical protein
MVPVARWETTATAERLPKRKTDQQSAASHNYRFKHAHHCRPLAHAHPEVR